MVTGDYLKHALLCHAAASRESRFQAPSHAVSTGVSSTFKCIGLTKLCDIIEKFVLTIEYGKKDACGNPIPTKTAGELRKIIQSGIDNAESITVDEIQGDDGKLEFRNEIRNIITTFFDLDTEGNPTIPTSNDVGQIDEIEYSSEVVDRIWRLVK